MPMTPTAPLEAQLNLEPGTDAALLAHKLATAEAWIERHTGCIFPTTPAAVPAPVTEAVLMLAAHWYENREATLIGASGASIPYDVAELLSSYRVAVTGRTPDAPDAPSTPTTPSTPPVLGGDVVLVTTDW